MIRFIRQHRKLSILAGCVVVLLLAAVAMKPSDNGAPYDEYFKALNAEMKKNGPGRPSLVLDLDRVDRNLALLKEAIKPPASFRLVVKSLPSVKLVQYVQKRMGSDRLMVFHEPDLRILARAGLGGMDMLLGKPMPVNAAREFYGALRPEWNFDPSAKVQWLVDSPERLKQYLALAREKNLLMRVNVEIDVGLHRGGLRTTAELEEMLALIAANPKSLALAGFMGYDVHTASAPTVFGSKRAAIDKAFQGMLDRYNEFFDAGKAKYPALFREGLTLNSGGSHTYMLFQGRGPVNDISAGSCIVQPSDFDTMLLERHEPALFIAAPVLKKISGTTIPFIEGLAGFMSAWNPNKQLTYFIYGGGWMARFTSPAGLEGNAIYGFSTNQSIVNGSARTALGADDTVFLRPTQSEAIMREFGDLLVVRGGKIIDRWPVFPE
ncbi:MAG: hypothetical protein EPN93_13475 [Spirochaetes bacterium]|nr:MAG: hypothetical protein EPN93_13475 [Spirochaetota bacterium]